MSPSRALFLILALLSLAGCRERSSINNVTALEGDGTCRIRIGEERDNVLMRCGPPCARGNVPEGQCPEGRVGTCENHCDIYFDVEVCYAAGRSVSVRRLDREFDRFEWCVWPNAQAAQPRPPR